MRPKISTFPLDKPFEQQPVANEISQLAVRILVDLFGTPVVVGTGTVIGPYLVLTARHVLQEIVLKYGARDGQLGIGIQILQTFENGDFFIWDVIQACAHQFSDIALFSVAAVSKSSKADLKANWTRCPIEPFPPPVGERVAAFGYRHSRVQLTEDRTGKHIKLRDEPMMSVGIVREHHEVQRDSNTLPFPCYQVSARFDGGMSGGPVFDETGAVCGIVCSNFPDVSDGEPISYVTTLWRFFDMEINIDRGADFPRGVTYRAAELLVGNRVMVTDISRLLSHFADMKARSQFPG